MASRRIFLRTAALAAAVPGRFLSAAPGDLDPRGRIHIPIGIPDTLDTLKTFVEAEGNFSPGFGTYGIYFWLFDVESGKLAAPTMDGIPLTHGLAPGALLIPWSEWEAFGCKVRTEVCEVQVDNSFIVAARVRVSNAAARRRSVALYAALRPSGAAGGDVHRLSIDSSGSLLQVDGHTALVADRRPSGAGVLPTDTIGNFAASGRLPAATSVESLSGDCSGAMRFDMALAGGASAQAGFICPVLPGRSAARHRWVDMKQNAMVDAAELNPETGGIPQPDPGPAWYRGLRVDAQFEKAAAFWSRFLDRIDIRMPDPRWGESMKAILAHAGLCMNEGAPDVAVINYNVFNRDGMYIANIMQKAGQSAYSERVLDYFISHPFNGRAHPEADNPGQILWAIHQHWLLTRDRAWLARTYPAVRKIAEMIRYYRTTPGPHWVSMQGLAFAEAAIDPKELKPGSCDGFHPEYTEAFDIAGLRGAAELAEASNSAEEAAAWRELADLLCESYDRNFGTRLARQYGSYAVLWPCRLYPTSSGGAWEQFRSVGAQKPESWRYFPLARSHQGLLAGNRAAGHGTLAIHLEHEQMRGWYAFDEGGGSGGGAWYRARTTWTHSKEKPGDNLSVAMPHGWAIAEFWLLMRDSLAFEDGKRLVLLAGIPEEWFRDPRGMSVRGLCTYFGRLDFSYKAAGAAAELELTGTAAPPDGFILRLPPSTGISVWRGGECLPVTPGGDCLLPSGTAKVRIRFS
jgi:hypothetical protein